MMKSFFKKLAFVMALAMVVSAMAPAATAKAAETKKLDICFQEDASWTPVEAYEFTEGDAAKDFKFANAPTEWRSLGLTWTSENPEVATVDQTGLITPVAVGESVVTLKGGDYVGSIKITVNPKENPAAFEAKQKTEDVVTLTFNDTKITKAALEAGLKVFYCVEGYDIEVQLIKSIGDVKNGVVDVTLYGRVTDGVEYKFVYNEYPASFLASIGTVSTVEVVYDTTKNFVETDIVLDVVLKNEKGVDITKSAKENGYVAWKETPAANNEYWLSDNVLYFTTEAVALVVAEYHGFVNGNEYVKSSVTTGTPVVGRTKLAYTLKFDAAPAWTIVNGLNSESWKSDKINHDIAVGDHLDNLRLFIKTKEANYGTDAIFPVAAYDEDGNFTGYTRTDAQGGEYRFESAKPSTLYVTADGLLMPNTKGYANVLVYYKPANGTEMLLSVVNVYVSPERAVTYVDLDKTSATVSTVAGFNTASFKFTLKDGLKVPFTNDTVSVECTTKPTGLTQPTVSVSETNAKGEVTVTVTATTSCVADAGTQTYYFTAKSNGVVKNFSVTVKDPKGTPGNYANLSFGIDFGGDKKIKMEDEEALVLTASLSVLSNGAAVGNQVLAGKKVDITADNIEQGKVALNNYYYVVTLNDKDITDSVVINGDKLEITLTKTNAATAAGLNVQLADYTSGAGTYKVTVYKPLAKAGQTTPAYYSLVKSNYIEVKVEQPAVTLAGEKANTTSTIDERAVVTSCWKFKLGNDEITDFSDYLIDVDYNYVAGADIFYVNSVTFYQNLGEDVYVKHVVDINDYVTITE